MIRWPSLVKLDGDDELIYVASENDFQAECSDMILGEDDYLIDSEGDSYALQSSSNQLSLTKRPERYSVCFAPTDLSPLYQSKRSKSHG
ncbi:DUF4144 family protein [Vibrio chagasii]|uniref:DUF4144 family protein n=1 Tax=Vibrio chagasii TaxID=170679 RepID=UPI0038CDA58E